MGKKPSTALRWYAVAAGRQQGVFRGWSEGDCAEEHVKGYKGQLYKGFDSEGEAKAWLAQQLGKKTTQEEGKENAKRPRETTPPPPKEETKAKTETL